MITLPYDRAAAVAYAHQWAYKRNPRFYDFELLGGDCTNFASQCIYAGSGIMNYRPTLGWYYIDANNKAPAWTGVPYLFNFLTRAWEGVGPFGRDTSIWEVLPGDVVQLSFNGIRYQHSPVIVEVGNPPSPDNVLIAAHSVDRDYYPLSEYDYKSLRFVHILGVNHPNSISRS